MIDSNFAKILFQLYYSLGSEKAGDRRRKMIIISYEVDISPQTRFYDYRLKYSCQGQIIFVHFGYKYGLSA